MTFEAGAPTRLEPVEIAQAVDAVARLFDGAAERFVKRSALSGAALTLPQSFFAGAALGAGPTLKSYTANLLNISNWVMAWRYNGLYSLGCLLLSVLVIVTFHYLQ